MNAEFETVCETIADGLAARGYACSDFFLSEQESAAIRSCDEFTAGRERFRRAGTGRDRAIADEVRGDFIQWIDRGTASAPLRVYLNRLTDLTGILNRSLFLSLRDYEVHATAYPPGTGYKKHTDQLKTSDHRKLSVICYLNKDWLPAEGGQLRMHLADGPVDVFPAAGTLVCFRSDQVEHEVLPAVRERLSLTGWLLDRLA